MPTLAVPNEPRCITFSSPVPAVEEQLPSTNLAPPPTVAAPPEEEPAAPTPRHITFTSPVPAVEEVLPSTDLTPLAAAPTATTMPPPAAPLVLASSPPRTPLVDFIDSVSSPLPPPLLVDGPAPPLPPPVARRSARLAARPALGLSTEQLAQQVLARRLGLQVGGAPGWGDEGGLRRPLRLAALFDSPLPDHAIEAIDCLVQEAKTPRKSGGKAAGEDHGALEPLTAV